MRPPDLEVRRERRSPHLPGLRRSDGCPCGLLQLVRGVQPRVLLTRLQCRRHEFPVRRNERPWGRGSTPPRTIRPHAGHPTQRTVTRTAPDTEAVVWDDPPYTAVTFFVPLLVNLTVAFALPCVSVAAAMTLPFAKNRTTPVGV